MERLTGINFLILWNKFELVLSFQQKVHIKNSHTQKKIFELESLIRTFLHITVRK